MPIKVPVHEWLVDVRTNQKLGQDEVDRRTKELGARISQSYLSQLERGVKSLEDLGAAKMDALRRVYKISLEEWTEKTGLAIVTPAHVMSGNPHRGPIPPIVDPIELPLNIPAELQEMIDEYGDRHPELRNETTLRALVAPRLFAGHSQGPQTADQWYEYFLMNRRWLPQ